jgi:hypothetical protein
MGDRPSRGLAYTASGIGTGGRRARSGSNERDRARGDSSGGNRAEPG